MEDATQVGCEEKASKPLLLTQTCLLMNHLILSCILLLWYFCPRAWDTVLLLKTRQQNPVFDCTEKTVSRAGSGSALQKSKCAMESRYI